MKFGGTSVGTPQNIGKIIKIVKTTNADKAIIVSAYNNVTNQLIAMAQCAASGDKQYRNLFKDVSHRHLESVKKLIVSSKIQNSALRHIGVVLQDLETILLGLWFIRELSPKTLDLIMSFGERLSGHILAESMRANGLDAEFVDARKVIKTNNQFNNAKVEFGKTNKNILKYFNKNKNSIKVITGFIGSTKDNETTTLGRGGSDYTASIFGAALQAEKIEIWTDVDGVMTADPKKISTAFSIPRMTYEEAMEMSHFGAKVIHPPTMIPAMDKNIPLVIRNTFHPEFSGTSITHIYSNGFPIKGITSISNIAIALLEGSGMVGIPGVAMRLFGALGRNNINIILITQASSEHTICFAIDPKDIEKTEIVIKEEFAYEMREKVIENLNINNNYTIIAIVGDHMRKIPGIAGKLFTALGDTGINVSAIAQGSSERNISLAIAKKDEKKALHAIHKAFFGDPKISDSFASRSFNKVGLKS